MTRTLLSWLRCVRGPRLMVALAALALSACYESDSITCSSGLVCPGRTTCSADGKSCLTDPCGDSIRQASEACDDGNKVDGDGCSSDCRSTERCGNGILDRSAGEVCDDGNTDAGDRCSADCKSKEECGNGILDLAAGEVCDDGNKLNGDKCSANCKSTESCGNNVVDLAVGEVCDDGNQVNGDTCSSDCLSTGICGNGHQDEGEECDDGNADDTDGCVDECKLARCGDGHWNQSAGSQEQCDVGGESDKCNYNCKKHQCGDGIVNTTAGEQCDLGGRESSECTLNCRASFCGDGYTNHTAGEECDYKNPEDQARCLTTCKIDHCGDGDLDPGEACDDGNRDDCGTCNATCTKSQPAREARGTIEVVAEKSTHPNDKVGNLIRDGWKFTISDGLNLPRGFEFDKPWSGSVTEGYKPVPISDDMDSKQVAGVIAVVINSASALRVDATYDGMRKVSLTHLDKGTSGNQLIVGAPQDQLYDILMISGLSGGAGKDCRQSIGCNGSDICAPGLSCKGDPKTCQP